MSKYRSMVFGSIIDRRLKSGFRGKVVRLNSGPPIVLAMVYGETLEAMRERKRVVVKALQGLDKRLNEKQSQNPLDSEASDG